MRWRPRRAINKTNLAPLFTNMLLVFCLVAKMSNTCNYLFLVLLHLVTIATMARPTTFSNQEQQLDPIQLSRTGIVQAMNSVQTYTNSLHAPGHVSNGNHNVNIGVALNDCKKLYDDSEARLAELAVKGSENQTGDGEDECAVLSAALASHVTCLDGLEEMGFVGAHSGAQNTTLLLKEALALYRNNGAARRKGKLLLRGMPIRIPKADQNGGLLTSWNSASSTADFVVAKDGSGTYRTINEALAALTKRGSNRPERVIFYVKAGVYSENVEIQRWMKNLMFVGDGIDRTIVTGNKNVPDGSSTYSSATFGVSGDGFWARGITFENTAGPAKHQAVALRVNSDLSVFYQCSFKAYQDTLFVHSLRQFYRDCQVHGTIDFIFGDASAVLQNCDIYVRRPMSHQGNMITAQGRSDPHENTGISIHMSRVLPSSEFRAVKGSFRNYLGRPWKKYSRTAFIKTDLDGLIAPEGWKEWSGSFALSTLYYAEYMNMGSGASTDKRVKWPGVHIARDPKDVNGFTVSSLIQGEHWIPATGVPYTAGV